jgi:hypothetical protein
MVKTTRQKKIERQLLNGHKPNTKTSVYHINHTITQFRRFARSIEKKVVNHSRGLDIFFLSLPIIDWTTLTLVEEGALLIDRFKDFEQHPKSHLVGNSLPGSTVTVVLLVITLEKVLEIEIGLHFPHVVDVIELAWLYL